MKNIIFLILITLSSSLFAKQHITVSIAPIKSFIKQIAKNKVNVEVMIKKGSSAHSYLPKPSQMKQITKSNIYFAIGIEFEDIWLEKFHSLNKNMKIIHLDENINKLHSSHEHEDEDNHKNEDEKEHESEEFDPHIWTSITNIKIISKKILNSLAKHDNKNKIFYTNNYNDFIEKLNSLDLKIKKSLLKKQNSAFMVFHPSWQYFAKQYKLNQIAIEQEGKSPKPKHLKEVIQNAKNNNIKVIIVNPNSKNKIYKIIANQLNIKVIKIDPLSLNILDELLLLAKSI